MVATGVTLFRAHNSPSLCTPENVSDCGLLLTSKAVAAHTGTVAGSERVTLGAGSIEVYNENFSDVAFCIKEHGVTISSGSKGDWVSE